MMAGLGRSYALQLANECAKAQQGENFQWAAETFGQRLFDHVWADGKEVDTWSHVTTRELTDSVSKFSIDRAGLRTLAEEYIEHKGWLRNRHFDWLLADLLVYAELSAFILHVHKRLHFSYSTGAKIGSAIAFGLWGLVKLLIWLAVLILAFSVSPTLGWAFAAVTVAYQIPKYIQRRKRARLTQSMIDVYCALDGTSLSWAVVWDLLAKSRALGAVWDPELYRLVELRRATRLDSAPQQATTAPTH